MQKHYLTPTTLPDWSNYFSQIVVIEKNGLRFIYVSGQVGVDRDKNLIGQGNLRSQLGQTFNNLQTALVSVKAKMTDIVKMNIYVVNYQPSDAEAIGEIIGKYFKIGQLPAMSLIGVQALAEAEFLVEVDAEAVVDRDSL